MNLPVPIPDPEEMLRKKMDAQIAEIRAVEHHFPGAVIIHDLRTSSVVYMSQWALNTLGVTIEELWQMGADYHMRFFNPEDSRDYAPKILGMLERNIIDEFICHFQQVRASPEHDWAWYLSGSRVFFRDDLGNPVLTLTIALPVDAQHHIAAKAQRLLEENNFLRNNLNLFNQLTRREKEILGMMAMDMSSEEMAAKLYISENTANTHRRNIKRKLRIETNYDIIRFAHAFDLV